MNHEEKLEHCLDAERAVLGSLLIDSSIARDIFAKVDAADFLNETNRRIFQTARALFRAGEPVDAVAIRNRMGTDYNNYFLQLMEITPTSANWEAYAGYMKEQTALQRVKDLAQELLEAHNLDSCRTAVAGLGQMISSGQSVDAWTMREMLDDFFTSQEAEKESIRYITYGIPHLDEGTYTEPGDVVMIGGYPSDGKTALALTMAYHMAAERKVGFFSLETDQRKIRDRMVSHVAQIDFNDIKRRTLNEGDWTAVAAKNQYIYDPSGSITELSGSSSGYYEIMTTGFSYDDGDVTVKEMQAPVGYTPIEKIVMGKRTDGTIGILSDSPLASYHNGLLIVENTTESTSVTAVKEWLCPEAEWTDDVTVQLLANGNLASALIPGVETTAVLTASGGWTYTWTNLPTHANGAEIKWSVRETEIGSEPCRQDFTFANWLVFYSDPVVTTDANGMVTNVKITIQNETRRTLLRLVKTDLSGTYRLSGATFTLQHLRAENGAYVDDPNFVTRTVTTGADGTLTFDNLLYGRYRLTEIEAPVGYELLKEPVYLTIGENGAVSVDGHDFAQPDSTAYSIRVFNREPMPLPSTGGSGTAWYYTVGGMLMLLAACGYILPGIKRKGRYSTDS